MARGNPTRYWSSVARCCECDLEEVLSPDLRAASRGVISMVLARGGPHFMEDLSVGGAWLAGGVTWLGQGPEASLALCLKQ